MTVLALSRLLANSHRREGYRFAVLDWTGAEPEESVEFSVGVSGRVVDRRSQWIRLDFNASRQSHREHLRYAERKWARAVWVVRSAAKQRVNIPCIAFQSSAGHESRPGGRGDSIQKNEERATFVSGIQKPSETTANAYRFEVKLGSDSTEKFPVAEERVYDSTTAVSNLTPDVLAAYVQNKAISDTGCRLQQIVDLKRQIPGLDNQIRQLDGDINNLTQDQNRIRQNMMSLNQVSGQQDQVQKYARN